MTKNIANILNGGYGNSNFFLHGDIVLADVHIKDIRSRFGCILN